MASTKTHRIALLLLATLVALPVSAGRLYKWTDEEGNVHYGSQIPPEYASQETHVLNEQAVTLETRDRELTEDELDAAAAAARSADERRREQEAQARADRILLDSYASVSDMEQSRDSRIAALEAQVNVTAGRISNLQAQVVELDEHIRSTRTAGREPDPARVSELAEARRQLLDNQRFLQARRDEQEEIRQQFAADIAHYLELKEAQRSGSDDGDGRRRP